MVFPYWSFNFYRCNKINITTHSDIKRLLKSIYKIHIFIVLKMFSLLNCLGIINFYQPLPQLGIKTNEAGSERTLIRWEAIKKELPAEPISVLDIGCNVGFYSIKMAKLGHFVTGFDNHLFSLLAFYCKEALGILNLALSGIKLNPKNIKTLPDYDCVLLLSVFHHWCVAYGADNALKMLDGVYKRTKKILFFETAQTDTASDKYCKVLPNMGGSPELWLHNYFKQKHCNNVKTISYIRGRYLVAVFK